MIRKIIRTVRGQKIYSQGTILFLAMSFSNIFMLIFHLFMVRALSPVEYGILNTLFACILFFSMPTGNLVLGMTRFIAQYHGLKSKTAIVKVLKGMFIRILGAGIFISLIVFISSGKISMYFKIPNLMSIYSMTGVVVTSLLIPLPWAGLKGLQKFFSLGVTMILTNISKLILAVIFVSIGLGVSGALNALTISNLICVLSGYIILRKSLRELHFSEAVEIEVDFKQIYYYILSTSLATLSFVLLTNLDLFYVKHFFTPLEAGFYSIAQVIGRMVLFLPSAICVVMFPKVADSAAREEETIGYLKHSSLYIIALVSTAAGIIAVFPEFFLKIFTGKVYPQCIPLVRRFAVTMGLFAISFNFMLYYLSLNRIKYVLPFIFLLVLEGLIIYFWHNSLIQILNVVIAISSILFLSNLVIIKKRFNLS